MTKIYSIASTALTGNAATNVYGSDFTKFSGLPIAAQPTTTERFQVVSQNTNTNDVHNYATCTSCEDGTFITASRAGGAGAAKLSIAKVSKDFKTTPVSSILSTSSDFAEAAKIQQLSLLGGCTAIAWTEAAGGTPILKLCVVKKDGTIIKQYGPYTLNAKAMFTIYNFKGKQQFGLLYLTGAADQLYAATFDTDGDVVYPMYLVQGPGGPLGGTVNGFDFIEGPVDGTVFGVIAWKGTVAPAAAVFTAVGSQDPISNTAKISAAVNVSSNTLPIELLNIVGTGEYAAILTAYKVGGTNYTYTLTVVRMITCENVFQKTYTYGDTSLAVCEMKAIGTKFCWVQQSTAQNETASATMYVVETEPTFTFTATPITLPTGNTISLGYKTNAMSKSSATVCDDVLVVGGSSIAATKVGDNITSAFVVNPRYGVVSVIQSKVTSIDVTPALATPCCYNGNVAILFNNNKLSIPLQGIADTSWSIKGTAASNIDVGKIGQVEV